MSFYNMKIIEQRINPSFESIFAVGVDEMSWDDLNETHYEWPKVSEVREGSGYMRLNFAVSSTTMLQIINRLETSLLRLSNGE